MPPAELQNWTPVPPESAGLKKRRPVASGTSRSLCERTHPSPVFGAVLQLETAGSRAPEAQPAADPKPGRSIDEIVPYDQRKYFDMY